MDRLGRPWPGVGPGEQSPYGEPFAWWGPRWTAPAAPDLIELIRGGMLAAEVAGLLWAMLARRASLVVVGELGGIGKTTLLTALLACYPPGTRRIYLRGQYEPFAFLTDAAVVPERSVVLVNEFSPHLPQYLWGAGVGRALAARERGFAVAGTAHAEDATGFVASLAGYPLRVPLGLIGGIDLVVGLGERGPGQRGEVTGVWRLRGGGGGERQLGVTVLYRKPAATEDISHGRLAVRFPERSTAVGVGTVGEGIAGGELGGGLAGEAAARGRYLGRLAAVGVDGEQVPRLLGEWGETGGEEATRKERG